MLVTRGDACTVFAVWAFDVLSACYPVTTGITSEDPDAGKALEPVRGQPAAIVGGQMREYQVVDFSSFLKYLSITVLRMTVPRCKGSDGWSSSTIGSESFYSDPLIIRQE